MFQQVHKLRELEALSGKSSSTRPGNRGPGSSTVSRDKSEISKLWAAHKSKDTASFSPALSEHLFSQKLLQG